MATVRRPDKTSPPVSLAKWYISLGLLLSGMTALLLYAYATGTRMVSFQAPLVYAAKQIQLETISGHLWFEEVLHGERDEPLEGVWDHYQTAIMYADAMLRGGTSPEGPIAPLDDPELRQQISDLKDRFQDLREVTLQRFERERMPHPPGEDQDRYHHLFHQLMHAAGNVEGVLEDSIERELGRFRVIHLGLVLVGFFGAGLVAAVFLRFERRTTLQFRELAAARRQVAESEDRFRRLFDHMADPLFVVALGGSFLDVNRRACEVLGYTRGELLTMGAADVDMSFSREEIAGIHARLEPGNPLLVEGTHRRKDGSTFPVEVHLQRLPWGDQNAVIGLARDISERKEAEASLRESEQWYQSLAEVSPVGIFRADPSGGYVYVNRRWSQLAGLEAEESFGEGWTRAIHPDDREQVAAAWNATTRGAQEFRTEYRLRSPTGVTTWVLGHATAVRSPDGEALGYVGTVTDISDSKRVEETLREARDDLEQRIRERTDSLQAANVRLMAEIEQRTSVEESLRYSEAKYSTLVESSPSGIFIYRDGRFVFVNPALVDMSGYTAEELLTMDVPELAHPEDRIWIRETARRRLAGEPAPQDYEIRFLTKAGETRWIHIRTALIQYRGGLSTLGNVTDVTERKRMAEALRSSEEELRRLSNEIILAQEEERARIARELHDSIGQSLSAIKFHVESVMPRCDGKGEQPLRAVVARVQETVEEVRRISMALRPSILDDLGLVATIGWHCREFEGLHPDLRVIRDLGIDEDEVPERLKIVIFRILQETMSNVGEHSGAKEVKVALSRRKHLLELRVSDDGKGFDLEAVNSHRPPARGYGLASMRERAEMSGGELSIEVPETGGTIIRATWDLSPVFTG